MIVIILFIPQTKKQTPSQPKPTKLPLPTLIEPKQPLELNITPHEEPQGPDTFPTLPPLAPTFTGGLEKQNIPQEETDLAVQKRELRQKTPLSEDSFTITFDYANDIFIVTLKEPKDINKKDFDLWLNTNYPNIPLDRFGFK